MKTINTPKASNMQTGRYDVVHLSNNSKNQNSNNFEIEDPIIEEPDFIKEIIKNNGNDIEEDNQPLIKSKYNIIELFYLIDEEVFFKDKQVHCVDLSFNMDFGNLKISFFELTSESINNHVIFKTSMKLLISGTIYPSSAFRVLNSNETKIVCMEQLINNTNEQWQKERPMVEINHDLEKDNYSVTIYDHLKNKYTYIFKDWQKKAFEKSLKFVYNEGLNLKGNTTLRR